MVRRRGPAASRGDDGYWHTWVTVGTKSNGRPDQRHVQRDSKAAAEARADELLEQAAAGRPVKAGRLPTVEDWFTRYLEDIAPRRCNPSTIYHYRSILRTWLFPAVGRRRIDRLSADELEAVYNTMRASGRSEGYQLFLHRIVSRALTVAVRRKLCPVNVATLLDPPSGAGRKIDPLTVDAARAILAVAAGRRNGARWAVALAMGLRQGEAIGLRWSEVDLDHGLMRVWQQLQRRIYEHGCDPACGRRRAADCPGRRDGGGLVFVGCKGKSRRTIAIPPQLLSLLREHRRSQQAERLAWPGPWAEHDVVFAALGGDLIDPQRDRAEWLAVLAEAGVPAARLHSARHTAATLLLAQGVDITVVKEILGHQDIRTTQGYADVVDKLHQAAAQAIGDALFAPTGAGSKIRRVQKRVLN